MIIKLILPTIFLFVVLSAFSPSSEKVCLNDTSHLTDSIPVFLEEYQYDNADGTMFSFDQVKGKVLLLDFWATWCGPCIRAHPDVVALENRLNDPNFQVITVSIDKDKSKWKEYIAKNKWTSINIILDRNDSNNSLNKMVTEEIQHDGKTVVRTSVPRYFLIDTDLKIIELDDERKAQMVSNLLVVLCGEENAQPIINSGSLY